MYDPAYTAPQDAIAPAQGTLIIITEPKEPTDQFFWKMASKVEEETPLFLDILQRLKLPYDMCLETANENLYCIKTGQKNSGHQNPLKSDYIVQMYRIIQFAAWEMLRPHNRTISLSSLFPESTNRLKQHNLTYTSVGEYVTHHLVPLLPLLEQEAIPHIEWNIHLNMILAKKTRAKRKASGKKRGRPPKATATGSKPFP